MTKTKPAIPAEAFIEIWQFADSFREVMERTGLKQNTINTRANFYKAKGVPLKDLPRLPKIARTLDYDKLAELAKRCESDKKQQDYKERLTTFGV